jgi:hypothetical protein
MSDNEIKKRIILNAQPQAQLEGKSETYINARFDSVLEDLPGARVIANPSKVNNDRDPESEEKDRASAVDARKNMIRRQKLAYKGGK